MALIYQLRRTSSYLKFLYHSCRLIYWDSVIRRFNELAIACSPTSTVSAARTCNLFTGFNFLYIYTSYKPFKNY